MLRVRDLNVRLVVLSYVAAQVAESIPRELIAAGIHVEQIEQLRQLSATNLNRLARMRHVEVRIAFDVASLKAGLSAIHFISGSKELETYFIRHGASVQMMRRLFKVRRNVTIECRRLYGVYRPRGRIAHPDAALHDQIQRVWKMIQDPNPRTRYFQLHQAFPNLQIAVLAAAVSLSGTSQ